MNNLLVSGISFVKNGLTLGYPILESILSIDPLCDEIVINVGMEDEALTKDDGTYEYLRDHLNHKKYKFIKNYWSPSKTSQGLILSEQTNIALSHAKGRFVQYIQADEAIHEDDLSTIHNDIIQLERDKTNDGIVFNYIHFYGSPDSELFTRRVYKREIRLIRNHQGIVSHLDAQGFKTSSGEKIKCTETQARIFHYGWARKEILMDKKIKVMDKLYHGHGDKKNQDKHNFKYKKIWGIKNFNKTHPKVMNDWIEKNRPEFDIHQLPLQFKWQDLGLIFSDYFEKITGYRLGEYKNFRL